MRNGDYELVIAPENYPGKKYRGRYCYEHHLVYWQNTGIILKKDEVVHHKNENKRYNKFSNLELKKKLDHDKEHSTTGRTMITIVCAYCEKSFEKEYRNIGFKIKRGQKNFYCNRTCCGKANQNNRSTSIIRHGEEAGYHRGCRCLLCKNAHNKKMRDYRKSKKILLGTP